MNNTINFHSDGTNVHITSSVHTSSSAKLFLTLVNIGILLLHAFFIFEIEKHELKKLLIPTIVSTLVFTYFPWRYWLWRFYGKETLTINNKDLTYSYDYGIFKTKKQTIEHSNLSTAFEPVRQVNGEECGNVHFLADDPKTKGRQYIHETTVLIPKKELVNINTHLTAVLKSSQQPNVA
jgi:hypothetical protein